MIDWKPIAELPLPKMGKASADMLFIDDGFVFEGYVDHDGDVWARGSPFDTAVGWSPSHFTQINKP